MPTSTTLRGIAVDDIESMLSLYEYVFKAAGIAVEGFLTNEAAMASLDDIVSTTKHLDFVITDLVREKGQSNGVDLIRYIRSLGDEITIADGKRLNRIPIVVISGWGRSSPERTATEEIDPTIPIFEKPLESGEILKAVEKVLAQYRRNLLSFLDFAGIAIVWENGAYRVVPGLRRKPRYGEENPFCTGPIINAVRLHTRLLRVADTWRFAEASLSTFEAILNDPGSTEADIHHFIESHPEMLGEAYDHFWSQPSFRAGKTIIRPDFIFQPRATRRLPWNWLLLDLKSPFVPLVTRSRFHPTLTSHVSKVVTQLRDYQTFFLDPRNADMLKRRFGGIVPRPRLTALIGRLPQDRIERYTELRDQIVGVNITTYDELLEERRAIVEWIRSNDLGREE